MIVSPVGLTTVCLTLVILTTIPSVQACPWRLFGRRGRGQYTLLYTDEDGESTEEEQAVLSDSVPFYGLLLASITGSVASLATAIGMTTWRNLLPVTPWTLSASWLLVVCQSIIVYSERHPPRRATLGLYITLASLPTAVQVALLHKDLDNNGTWSSIYLTLKWLQVGAVLVQGINGMRLPRRPDVYWEGQVVDREYTSSFGSRISFGWASRVLDLVKAKRNLKVEDLPILQASMRTTFLFHEYRSNTVPGNLWRTLFATHRKKYLLQWLLVVMLCATQLLPQYFLLQLLRGLETRKQVPASPVPLSAFVVGLGLSITVNSWVENSLNWLSSAKIGLAIHEQLSAMIVWKGVRRKHGQEDRTTDQNPHGSQPAEVSRDAQDTKATQSPINHLAVDVPRVADYFASANYRLVSCILRIIISFAFLSSIVGPGSLAVGLAGFLLSAPFHLICTRKYSTSQRQLMKLRDRKLAVVSEALLGIRQIKLSALEDQWNRKIDIHREEELKAQWRTFRFKTGLVFVWVFGSVMLSAITLGTYVLLSGQLTASVTFTTISIFNGLEWVLGLLPQLMSQILNATISATRIEQYLGAEELNNAAQPDCRIRFERATVQWLGCVSKKDAFALHDIDLSFPINELSIVSGRVGAGKSLLLAAILGEAEIIKGNLRVPRPADGDNRFNECTNDHSWTIDSSFAYVSQTPWIQNATVHDNILFGLPFRRGRYKEVIHACALDKDLELLPFGDRTDIGVNGVNLSGGQKCRLAVARALYSRASILILDDIFSALDANVGKFVYENAVTGDLGRGRTRILVTHHLSLCLSQAVYCAFLADGTVQLAGPKQELLDKGLLSYLFQGASDESNTSPEKPIRSDEASTCAGQDRQFTRNISMACVGNSNTRPEPDPQFMAEETRDIGRTKLQVYGYYVRATGFASCLLVMVSFVAFVGTNFGRTWWVSVWTRSYEEYEASSAPFRRRSQQSRTDATQLATSDTLWHYLSIYLGLSCLVCFLGTIRYYFVFLGSIRASRAMFQLLSYVVLHMPLRWLDTVPVGRILNRLTADFNVVDSSLAESYAYVIHNLLVMVGTVVAGLGASLYVVFIVAILIASSVYYGQCYLVGVREVKRLESITRSPIYDQFGSVMEGITTIRAFGLSNLLVNQMHQRIDDWARTSWHLGLFSRWLNLRLNLLGSAFSTLTAAIVVTARGIDAPLAGFCLSFVLQFSQTLIYAVRDFASLEMALNAVERISEYCNLTPEDQCGLHTPGGWPTRGEIEVSNLTVSYAPDLDPVLKDLTFAVHSTEKVGVVGRTGAGKSSLTLALFRFLEAQKGSISIDGLDLSKLRLRDLRGRVSIIPQDPVLFSGTIRSNLDPFDQHSNVQLYDAMQRVYLVPCQKAADCDSHLEKSAASLELESPVSHGGSNLSQGQRQLICLARAIVSRPKIIVLDEATSAVDKATDQLIQQSIRDEFTDSTLLVIAHRLSTVADFDRIMVLNEGKLVEYDSPVNLIVKQEGAFADMVQHSHDKDTVMAMVRGTC